MTKQASKKKTSAKKLAASKKKPEPTKSEQKTVKPEEQNEGWHWIHDAVLGNPIYFVVGLFILLMPFCAWLYIATMYTTVDTSGVVTNINATTVEELPTVLPRQIDGIEVAREDANKTLVCVMIENAAFDGVRPQSGLSAASVVYEVVVEGGITRLMAVFAGEEAESVGPVRSARDTYLEFASELDCAYTHAGGSYTAMQSIPRFELKDLDALRESKWFSRVAGKVSPHNLFTSTEKLYEAVEVGHSWTEEPEYDSWQFIDDEDFPENEEAVSEVTINFGGSYNSHYVYNEDEGYYERFHGSVAHTDANTGDILTARNIVIQHVPPGVSIEGKGRINFSVTGEGDVEIYRNGSRATGYWKKDDRTSRTHFVNGDGEEIPLAIGNTWVEIVPEGISVDIVQPEESIDEEEKL